MGRCLRKLEQSIHSQVRPRRRIDVHAQSMRVEGASTPLSVNYDEQIAIIRGKRVGTPTRSLQELEDRVLNRKRSAQQPQREVRRIDQAQVAGSPSLSAPYSAHRWQWGMSVPPAHLHPSYRELPFKGHTHAGTRQPATSQSAYSPELSAPNTGRFYVEPFADPLSPEAVFRANPALESPTNTTQPARLAAAAPLRSPVNGGVIAAQPVAAISQQEQDDDFNWLARARSEEPTRVTEASKKALASGAAVAKDDFEHDLASILGHNQPTQNEPAFDPSKANTGADNTQAAQADLPPAGNAPPPHPSHDVFDQMGLAMGYATSFDLGNVALKDRFDQFDQELTTSTATSPDTQASMLINPFVDPLSLNEVDLVAELAEIDADRSVSPTVEAPTTAQQPELEQSPTQQPSNELAPNIADPTVEQAPSQKQSQGEQVAANQKAKSPLTASDDAQQNMLQKTVITDKPNLTEDRAGEDYDQSTR